MRSFNRRQWLTILVFAVADFCAACCVSLQSPFYPQGKEIFSKYLAYVLYYVFRDGGAGGGEGGRFQNGH